MSTVLPLMILSAVIVLILAVLAVTSELDEDTSLSETQKTPTPCPQAELDGLALMTARAALAEIARISAGPIRRIALDALEKMETD